MSQQQPPPGGTPPEQPVPPQQPVPPEQPPLAQDPDAPQGQPSPPLPSPPLPSPPQPPGLAVPPGGPGMPPPGPPVATPGGNFRSGKNKTIAIIFGAVVGIGVLGALGAAVFGGGHEATTTAKSVEPGSPGSGILHPTPVGAISTTPAPAEATPTESASPAPVPTPEPTPEVQPTAPAAGGDVVTIGNGVQIAVPSGWHVLGDQGDSSVNLADDSGSWIYALTGTVETTADAASVLQGNLDAFLPGDYYSQLQLGDINALDPFGSIVSAAVINYQGQWVDSQGSTAVRGTIYAAVRQDGSALLMSAEHSPPKDFQDSSSSWGPVIDASFNAFGGS